MNKKIKMLRELNGWNQSDLARELEVNRATVNRWENGSNQPSMKQLHKINQLLMSNGIDRILPTKDEVDELMRGEGC